jgi:hypothetical protein
MKVGKKIYYILYMSLVILKNNNQGHNLIDHIIGDIYDIASRSVDRRDESLLETTITFYNENYIEKVKVDIITNSNMTFSKTLVSNYSSALITDSSTITNFNYLLENFLVSTRDYKLVINGENYTCNKFFNINGMNYYILNKTS